jgi:hypothetical protein
MKLCKGYIEEQEFILRRARECHKRIIIARNPQNDDACPPARRQGLTGSNLVLRIATQ